MTLPPSHKPFPAKYPYFVRSDLYKLGDNLHGFPEDHLFIVDKDYPAVIETCLAILEQYPQYARTYINDDLDGLTDCLWQIADLISRSLPYHAIYTDTHFTSKLLGITLFRDGRLQFNPDTARFPKLGRACYEHLQTLAPLDKLCDLLRLSVEEDLVIGRVAPDFSSDVMECMLVPIPSKWDPLDKIGLSFASVHAPIPESERLVSASPQLVKAIMTRGEFVRYNWTLGTSRWDRNPATEGDYREEQAIMASITSVDDMLQKVHFRSERQTFHAFPDLNRYLFIIHTYIHPLGEIVTTRERQQHLCDVLGSMDDSIRKHRTLAGTVYDYLSQSLATESN